jgi:dUTP pyrophosphatase
VIQFQKLFDDVRTPHRIHDGDAAFDVYSYEQRTLLPSQWQLCKTGLKMALPHGYVALVLPRSGLALRHGITVLNSPGLVDPNYRGELGVNLINHGPDAYRIERGDRIAQLLVVKYAESNSMVVDVVPPAPDERGAGGFGSTGR